MIKYTALFGLLAAPSAFAQEAPAPDAAAVPADTTEVLVNATRAPTTADRIAASLTVIDKAAIDRSQDLTVAGIVARTPGIALSRNGGMGTVTALRIRGAESDQTVVVVDGVKLNDPASTGGGYDFGNLLVGDVARIEVLRGPQSILWGSQAIGGVVNIVTPLPERELEGSIDLEGGSHETVSARAGVGGRTGPLAWRVGAQAFTTAGISAVAPSAGGREADGYSSRSVMGRARLELAQRISAEARGFFSDGRVEIDGFAGDTFEYSRTRQFVGYTGLNVDLFGGRLRNRIGYGYTNVDRESYNPARGRALTFDVSGRNERLEYQGSFAIASGWDATFGIEDETSRLRTVSPPAALTTPIPAPARAKAGLTGIYAQLRGTLFDGLTLTGGIRNDDHSRYGSKTLFGAGGAWVLPTGTTLRANYAEGFKAPSLYQLFSEYGNAALAPEEARGWEAGVEQRLFGEALRFGATYFERRTTGQIDFFSCFGVTGNPLCVLPGTTTPRFGYYANVARAFARGVEASAEGRIGALTIAGNYSWIEAEDRSPGSFYYGRQLPRRPRSAGNASVDYAVAEGASLGAAVRWSGATFDNGFSNTRLAPYALVDLRGEFPLTKQVALFARAENLLDKQYATASGFGTLGRSIYAGLRGRF